MEEIVHLYVQYVVLNEILYFALKIFSGTSHVSNLCFADFF